MDKTKTEFEDRLHTECLKCKHGKYVETTIFDDWHGYIHCGKCNHKIRRFKGMPIEV